jgi:hypothetical protein
MNAKEIAFAGEVNKQAKAEAKKNSKPHSVNPPLENYVSDTIPAPSKVEELKQQIAELERQKREIEEKGEYDNWFNDKELVISDVCDYFKAEAQKSYELLIKAGINRDVANYQLSYCENRKIECDDSIAPEIIEIVWNSKHKKGSKSATGMAQHHNPIGEGKRRCEREQKLNEGKMSDKIMGMTAMWKGYNWGLLERGKQGMKDAIIIARQGESYSLPVWGEIIEIIGKDCEWKKKEDMVAWIAKNMKK